MLANIMERVPLPPRVAIAIRIGQILLADMRRCDLFKHASAMAYVTLFSLIPSLAATFGLISLFSPFLGEDSALLGKAKEFILANLAAGSGDKIMEYIDTFLANLDMTKIGLTGIAGLLISLIMLLRQIEIALNRIWLVQKPRNIVTRFIHFWTFLTLGTVLGGLSIGILSGFNLESLNPFEGGAIEQGKNFFQVVTPFALPLVFFTLVYKIVPNTFVSMKDALWGAVPATLMFSVASSFYGYFTSNFTNYQAVYGALAALPVFLMWLYILWIIILLGALLSWRAQQSFDLDDKMDEQNPNLTPEEKLRNHQIQSSIPFLCLLAIYERYQEGDGQGVSGNEISMKLNVSAPWTVEALEALEDMGYAIRKHTPDDETDDDDYLRSHYFPAFPSDKLILLDLKKRFSAATFKWLTDWQHTWPKDLKPALKHIWESEQSSIPKDNMAKILSSLKQNSAEAK